MKNLIKAIFSASILASSASHALTGNEMLADLQRNDVSYEYGYSSGVLVGVVEISSAFQSSNLCIPEGVSNKQINDVVKSNLQMAPERRHMNASFLAYMALIKTWPCPKNNLPSKSK